MKDYVKIAERKKMIKFIEGFQKYYWDQGLGMVDTAKKLGMSEVACRLKAIEYRLQLRNLSEALTARWQRAKIARKNIYSKKRFSKSKGQSERMKEVWRAAKEHGQTKQ